MLCSRKKDILTTSFNNVAMDAIDTHSNQFEHDIESLGMMTLFLSRGKGGYGFSVTGAKPCIVGKIHPGSTAAQAGLEKGDHIIRINGQKVSHLDMVKVAAIVKACERHLLIDIYRLSANQNGDDVMTYDDDVISGMTSQNKDGFARVKECGIDADKLHGYSLGERNLRVLNDVTNAQEHNKLASVLEPWKNIQHISPWELYRQLKERQALISKECNMNEDIESNYSYSFTDDESISTFVEENMSRAKILKLSQSKENISAESMKSTSIMNWIKVSRTSYDDKNNSSSISSISQLIANSKENLSRTTRQNIRKSASGRDHETSDYLSGSEQNHSRVSEDSGVELASSPISQNISENECEKRRLIRELFKSEHSYCATLRQGITQYVEPIRNDVINSEQHALIFQNIEQLYLQSESLLHRLQHHSLSRVSLSNDLHDLDLTTLDNFGSILSARIDHVCIQYERYCSGVREGITLYTELRKIKDFERYLRKLHIQDKPSLSVLLQKPIEHIKNMTLSLQRIFKLTDSRHHDYESLQEVVRALRRCSGNISQEYIRQSQTNLTTILSPSLTTLQESQSSDSSQPMVDPEVMDIQNRLVFGDKEPTFDLSNASRHVIYTGDLLLQQKDEWQKVHVILFSDVILVTQKGADNFLTVLEKPILVSDVKQCLPASSKHPCEFTLKVECHHCETLGFEPAYHSFRAPSLEHKCVWKNLLEQRMRSVRSMRNLSQSRVSELL